MTIIENFGNFTTEHWEKFRNISNEQELAAFLAESSLEVSAEQKTALQGFLKTAK